MLTVMGVWIPRGSPGAAPSGSLRYVQQFYGAGRWGTALGVVEDPDGKGTVTALASDGRTVQLLVAGNCGLFPVTNAQGGHYEFDLGFRGTETGVGCSQVAGATGRSLVGLNVYVDNAGQPQEVQRTQIIVEATARLVTALPTPSLPPAICAVGQCEEPR